MGFARTLKSFASGLLFGIVVWSIVATALGCIALIFFALVLSICSPSTRGAELDDARATARKLLADNKKDDGMAAYKKAFAEWKAYDQIVVWVGLNPDSYTGFKDAVFAEHSARANQIGKLADLRIWHVTVPEMNGDATQRVILVGKDGNAFYIMPKNLDAARGRKVVSYWWGQDGRQPSAPQSFVYEEVTWTAPQPMLAPSYVPASYGQSC